MALTTEQIVTNHLHIGGLMKETNPKTRKFWLSSFAGQVVFDPEKIIIQLDNAKKKFNEAKKTKQEVLVVCEKSLYAEEVAELAKKAGFHYMNHKIPAGFLTNFDTLIKRIESMNEKKAFVKSEEYQRLTKKEQVMINRELKKVERIYEGVKTLKRKPDLVIVVDGMLMDGLSKEIQISGIDSIVLASSNFNKRWSESSLVTMNMQSYKSLDFALSYIVS